MAQAARDQNFVPTLLGVSNVDGTTPIAVYADPTTHRLLVDAAGGSGTVTSVSVVTANGFAGSVATATTTPAITLTTTINAPILAGNGTAISAATTTGSGTTAVLATAPVFPTTITVGAASGATGSILLKGTTSGTVTVKTADAAGTWTLTLPTDDGDNGEVLTTNGSGVTSWEAAPAAALVVGTTTITSGTTTRVLYDNAGVLGEYTISGSGNVAMTTSPVFTTPDLGTPSALVGTNITGTAAGLSIGGTAAVGTAVTVADETTDTSCFITFVTAATGNLGVKSNTNMTFNSNTGVATLASSVLTTTDINGGTIDGVTIGGASAGAITGTTITANTGFMPDANDGAYLGQAGTAFSDLFLAEGGVINWDSGDATITQTGNILAVAGADFRIATADVGTNADSVPTLSSTNTLTNKTFTAPTINAATLNGTFTLTESTSIALDPAQADGTWTGITRAGTAGATLAFGDLCYLAAADSRWELTDADSATTSDRMLGMCVLAAAADGDPTVMLLMGNIQAASKFPTMTIGSALYISDATAGAIITTIPTGADNVIRRVGYALTADELYFNPSMDSQITVA